MKNSWHKVREIALAILALVLVLSLAAPAAGVVSAEPEAVSVSVENPVLGEGNDFATQVLGLPWNMSAGPYPDYGVTFYNFDRSSFSQSGQQWSIRPVLSGYYDPYMIIHYPGITHTQKTLRTGYTHQINPNVYSKLAIRMYAKSGADNGRIIWYMAPKKGERDGQGAPELGSYGFAIKPGWNTYIIDLSSPVGQSGTPWNSGRSIYGLRIDPGDGDSNGKGPAGQTFTFDWIRLTSGGANSPSTKISWSGITNNPNLELFADRDCTYDDESIKLGEVTSAPNSGSFEWGKTSGSYPRPESLQPGSYCVFARVGGSTYPAKETLQILAAPILEFQQPSMFSGPDYASEVTGNAWGMESLADIQKNGANYIMHNISGFGTQNGEFVGVAGAGDNWAHLNVPRPIDTNKYHYVTFRYKLDATRAEFVSVQRFHWWDTRPEEARLTEDVLIHEGWHTYSFDLRTAEMDPGSSSQTWNGAPIVFRFDFHEENKAIPFGLDFVTLTGDHYIKQGSSFPIYYNLSAAPGAKVTFYLDTDRNLDTGVGAAIGSTGDEPPADAAPAVEEQAAARKIFMPLMARLFPTEINLLTGNRWDFNTANVNPGTYYIAAEVYDGYNTVTWHAEVPVIITP